MPTVGLVGCGNWGRNILRDLLALGATVHVADPNPAARTLALEGGAASAIPNHLDLPPCDGLVVAVPIECTGAVVLELLRTQEGSVPLFVEKPLAHTVDLARRIADAGAGRVFVMDKWRYHPAVEKVRSLIAEDRLGPVESISLDRWGRWDAQRSLSATWWLAPHDLSIVLHWLGTIPPVVCARSAIHGLTQDTWMNLQEGTGPSVTIDIRTASSEHRRSFTVVGRDATVHLSDADAEYLIVDNPRSGFPRNEQRLALARTLPLKAELTRFLGYLYGGPPPYSTVLDGLMVVERLARIDGLTAS
ncbi:MAG: hypothetical protein F2873_05810 [Actinobacteria bacterium]|uniref:Unannotated protein n=1 Tax=freshwater metagenome TaxID=449393 RepID=A0A6J6X7D1_9ZZZZ|nr:hypothetical protein [Actinomycetota bacterium]MSX78981.1 hypothetical protein [Actinomycetota bacterium]